MTTILVVDDDDALLENIADELEMRGYTAVKAANAKFALTYLQSASSLPDVIVSDVVMPGVSGYQLLAAVQQKPEWARIPFIFLSAKDKAEDIRQGKRQGADDYVTKPFQAEDLRIAIENKLRRVRQWQEMTPQQMDALRREIAATASNRAQGYIGELDDLFRDEALILEALEAMPDEFSHRALEAVQQGMKFVSRLIDQVLLLARIDRGSIADYLAENSYPCNLQSVVESAHQLARQGFEAEIPVHFTFPTNPVFVMTSFKLLATLVAEVMHNAFLFCRETPEVSVAVSEDGGVACIQVADRGIGISEEALPHVWERFARFYYTARPQQGAGLGLAIVYELLALMGGHLTLDSQPGEGTVVCIYLPRYSP